MPSLPEVTAREAARALRRAGFTVVRQRGGHQQLVNRATGRRVTIPSSTGDLSVSVVASILDQAGLAAAEFVELLH